MTPLKTYHRQIARGILHADRAQLAAARELDALHSTLCGRRGLRRLIKALTGRLGARERQGVYLWGGVGGGKTMLMDAFHAALPAGFSRRIHFHRFMQSVHAARATLRERQDPLAIIAAEWAARQRVLCLDEFTVTDITDAMLLAGLLRGLLDAGVTVVTTSNTRPDDLYLGGLQRARFLPAIELINARLTVLRVDGGRDYRLDRLTSQALYHTPHGAPATRAMRMSFAELEGDGDGDSHGDSHGNDARIELCGREVNVIAVGRGTVWFAFDALCGAGRSKADYIELAKRFHTLLLSDIPVMCADADDAARRFIELVDELYDRGVNLIASAAAPPDALYTGARLRLPFARTASRLREMGSREYLARGRFG